VSTSLVGIDRLAASERERERALRANQQAVRLVNLRYSSGLSAYFEVLDAMEQELAAENNLARTHRDRLVALVQFYRALGGGWQAEPASSTTPSTTAPTPATMP
jgi:multidrug efflux system outer membrane protein